MSLKTALASLVRSSRRTGQATDAEAGDDVEEGGPHGPGVY